MIYPSPPPDRCIECDAEVELDEPRMCYYTSRGHCGDCAHNCFRPILCENCELEKVITRPPPVIAEDPVRIQESSLRERRQRRIDDHLRTKEYTAQRKKELRDKRRDGRFA